MGGASQDGRSEPWPYVHSLRRCDRPSRAAGQAVLTWISGRGFRGLPGAFVEAGKYRVIHLLARLDPTKRGVCTHHARASSGRKTA